MRRVLWVSHDIVNKRPEVIDLDAAYDWGNINSSDPYQVGKFFHESKEDREGVWQEKVRTPLKDIFMMVDESGMLTDQSLNLWVSGMLYPGQIRGSVMICKLALEHTTEGPEENIVDLGDSLVQKLVKLLSFNEDEDKLLPFG